MEYKQFVNEVAKSVSSMLQGKGEVSLRKIPKNNGLELDCLLIREKGEMLVPNIYLQEYYPYLIRGEKIEDISKRIIKDYEMEMNCQKPDLSFLDDYSKVKTRLMCRLISRKRNKKMLSEVPHDNFLDLAKVYYCFTLEPDGNCGSILIRNDMLGLWNISARKLAEDARRNTGHLFPAELFSFYEAIKGLPDTVSQLEPGEKASEKNADKQANGILEEENRDEFPMYILTNHIRLFGAYYMSDPEMLEQAGRLLKGDFYILPSSVHECILVPVQGLSDAQTLCSTVREVNTSHVDPSEVLSDSVYRYDRKKKMLFIAAYGEESPAVRKTEGTHRQQN